MNMAYASLRRMALRTVGIAGVAGSLACGSAVAAQPRSDISPYLEVEQVFDVDLENGDTLTYTSVAAGIDAEVSTNRVDAQVSYRYERRIAWQDDLVDEDVHSGLAQARIEVARDLLSLDGGAIAARGRLNSDGPAFGFSTADDRNIAQIYGVYAGPTLSTHLGALSVNAAYRFGYVKVDDHGFDTGLPGGRRDRFDSSTNHSATASVGMAPGTLPFGWTVGAGYDREDSNRLDHEFEGKYVRGDVVLPVTSTVAVTGGVGYEKLEASQQDIVRDSTGQPVVTPGGRLVADPSKPRLLVYDQDGVIWDAGVIWRPNPRTELTARVGHRYGGTTYLGTLRYEMSPDYALNAVVYDSVTSFGRSIIQDINGLPVKFKNNNRGLVGGFGGVGGCVFGAKPGTGSCMDDAFMSVASEDFRVRGGNLILSGSRGAWDLAVGLGYARRKYLAAVGVGFFPIDGVHEESVTLDASIGRDLTATSGIDFDAYAAWYDSGIAGDDTIFSSGITATYYRSFLMERLQAEASLGLYTTDSGSTDSVFATGLVGLSYTF
jgi:uncharacterized protein (PEP-CTERM system associated)